MFKALRTIWEILRIYGTKVTISGIIETILGILRQIAFIGLVLSLAFTIIAPLNAVIDDYALQLITMIGICYPVLLIVSLLFQLIHRVFLGKYDFMKLKFAYSSITGENWNTIKFFRSISSYGTIELIVLIVLGFDVTSAFNSTSQGLTIGSCFSGFLCWCAVVLVLTAILDVLYIVFYMAHYGTDTYSIPKTIWISIKTSFMKTFHFSPKRLIWTEDDKLTAWMVIKFILGRLIFFGFIAFSVLGILNLLHII